MYVELHGKYFGAILFDFETRSSSKLFRIVAIQFVRSFNESRADCWEATCQPLYRNSATGRFSVPADAQVKGSNVTIKHALQGYALQNIEQERMNYLLTYRGSTSTSIISGQPYNRNMLPYLQTCHLQARTCQAVPQRTCHPLPKDLPSANQKKDLPSADQKNNLETCHLQARTCHP
jgi:hypothetical protein